MNWLRLLFIAALRIRYRVRVKGLDSLKLKDGKGVLFLPNHPSEIESAMLLCLLWPRFKIRPLAVEYVFHHPLIGPVARKLKALPIPNFDSSINPVKISQAKKTFAAAARGLKNGENFLLYPSSGCKNTGREIVGGASGAHSLVQECPNANIVLVRVSGLWGSSFSRALSGRTPDLTEVMIHAIKTGLKNLIFFAPKRDILIEFEANPPDLPRAAPRAAFNRYLENWYNRYPDGKGGVVETEPPVQISYAFWKKEIPPLYQRKKSPLSSTGAISSPVQEKIYAELRRILKNPQLALNPNQSLALDLAMDSLDIGDLCAFLAKQYDLEEFRPEQLETVQYVLDIAQGARAAPASPPLPASLAWPEEKDRPAPTAPIGDTLPEAFFLACKRLGKRPLLGDDTAGVLSASKAMRAVSVLAEKFRTYPEERIAVMLPSSAAAFLVILALQRAGKIPVMLNWTLGPRYLEEMMRLSGAKRTLTSWKFLDRLSHVDFGNLVEGMELLEDLKRKLSLKTKLKGALLAKFSRTAPCKETCVILFTSGTESLPKCVPLSHKNVLSMIQDAVSVLQPLYPTDVALSILPPFHSFGFAAVGFLALLSGAKTAFYPDPTDGPAIAERIARWKATVFPAPPSFLKRIFSAASNEQLKTIRLYISGAEKAPPELLSRIAEINSESHFIEGYGITECASAVSVHKPGAPLIGAGQLLARCEARTIHPDTQEPLPEGAEGELCLRGPSLFSGYLGSSRSPFIEIDGKLWYRTGDLGRIGPDRTVYLSGRLKRFAKLGGEMISLGAIEEALVSELIYQKRISRDVPSLAVCADEKAQGIVLFTSVPLEKEIANDILKRAGFSNLIKISFVKKIDALPLLATGKMDYRSLQALLA